MSSFGSLANRRNFISPERKANTKKMKDKWPKTAPNFPYDKGPMPALLDNLMTPGFDNGWNDPKEHAEGPDEWYLYAKDLELALSNFKASSRKWELEFALKEEELRVFRERALGQIDKLQLEVIDFEAEKENSEAALRALHKDIELKTSVMASREECVRECEAELENSRIAVSEQFAKFDADRKTLRRAKMEKINALAALQQKYDALQQKYGVLEKELEKANKDHRKARNEADTSFDNYTGLERSTAVLAKDLDKEIEKVAAKEIELKKEKAEAVAREAHVTYVEQKLNQLQEELENTQTENANYQARVDSAKEAQKHAEDARDAYKAAERGIIKDNVGLRENIKAQLVKIEALNREVTTLSANNATLTDATTKLYAAKGEIRALKFQCQRFKDDIEKTGFDPRPTAYTAVPGKTKTRKTMATELLMRDGLPILPYGTGLGGVQPKYKFDSDSSSDVESLPTDEEDTVTVPPHQPKSPVLPTPQPQPEAPVADPVVPEVVITDVPPVTTPVDPPVVVAPEPIIIQVPGPILEVPGPVVYVDRYIDRYVETPYFQTLLNLLVILFFWIRVPHALLVKMVQKLGLAPASKTLTISMDPRSPVLSTNEPLGTSPTDEIANLTSQFQENLTARVAGLEPLPTETLTNREQFQGDLPPPNGGPDEGPIMFAKTVDTPANAPPRISSAGSSAVPPTRDPVIEKILAEDVDVVDGEREEIPGEKPPAVPIHNNISSAVIANPPVSIMPVKKRLTWSYDTIFNTESADLPSLGQTLFGLVFYLLVLGAVFMGIWACNQRNIWLAANDTTRVYVLDLLNHPKQFYHGINRIVYALPEDWRRNIDILMWKLLVQGLKMPVTHRLPG